MSNVRKPVDYRVPRTTQGDRNARFASVTKGEGRYVYRNSSKATLMLPKPALNGQKEVPPNEKFEGDNYFMYLVKSGELRFVEEIQSPEQERNQNMLTEEKLILDQPDRVTNEGVVEQVVKINVNVKAKDAKKKKIVEQPEAEGILLTEDPLDGVQILG